MIRKRLTAILIVAGIWTIPGPGTYQAFAQQGKVEGAPLIPETVAQARLADPSPASSFELPQLKAMAAVASFPDGSLRKINATSRSPQSFATFLHVPAISPLPAFNDSENSPRPGEILQPDANPGRSGIDAAKDIGAAARAARGLAQIPDGMDSGEKEHADADAVFENSKRAPQTAPTSTGIEEKRPLNPAPGARKVFSYEIINFFTILQNASASEKYRNHASFELGPFEGVEQAGNRTEVTLIWHPGGKPLILKKTVVGSNQPPQEWEIRKIALAQSNNNQLPAIPPEKAASHFSKFDLAEAYKQYNGKLNSAVKPTATQEVIANLVPEIPRRHTTLEISVRDPQTNISVETALARILKEYSDSKWKKQRIEIGPLQDTVAMGGGKFFLELNPDGPFELLRSGNFLRQILTATPAEANRLNAIAEDQKTGKMAISMSNAGYTLPPNAGGKILDAFHDKLSFLSERAAEIRELMEYMREERRKLMEYEVRQRIYVARGETITFDPVKGPLLSEESYDLIPIWSRHIHGSVLFQVDFRNKRANREPSNRYVIALSQQELDIYAGDFEEKYHAKAILPEDAAIFFSKTTVEEILASIQKGLDELLDQTRLTELKNTYTYFGEKHREHSGKNLELTIVLTSPASHGAGAETATLFWSSDKLLQLAVEYPPDSGRSPAHWTLYGPEGDERLISEARTKGNIKILLRVESVASMFPEIDGRKLREEFDRRLNELLPPNSGPRVMIAR